MLYPLYLENLPVSAAEEMGRKFRLEFQNTLEILVTELEVGGCTGLETYAPWDLSDCKLS